MRSTVDKKAASEETSLPDCKTRPDIVFAFNCLPGYEA
jgi:hypothetical protein